MRAEEQMPVQCAGRIFLALCIILFMGCTTQGVPVPMGRYIKVRCRPDALSSNCPEQLGGIPAGAANKIDKAAPIMMRKFQEPPETSALSEEEYGSGNEMELESGSGADDDNAKGFIIPDFVLHQPDRDLKFRLTNEGLFLENQQL